MAQGSTTTSTLIFHNGENAIDFPFIPPTPGASRSPCPALNTLANHGYIPRDGTNIPFWTLFSAVKSVYNLTYALTFLLSIVGYLTCGTVSLFSTPSSVVNDKERQQELTYHPNVRLLAFLLRHIPHPTWTLDLSSLCVHGPFHIAHDASLVHTEHHQSTCSSPDPTLLAQLLSFACHSTTNTSMNLEGNPKDHAGLTLKDLSLLHASREAALQPSDKLSWFHERVALGECGLLWCVMRSHRRPWDNIITEEKREEEKDAIISPDALWRWFGQERLPDGWFDGGHLRGSGTWRPTHEVGLREAGKKAKEVGNAL